MSRWPEVLDCCLITGQREYLTQIVAGDLEAHEPLIKDRLTPPVKRASIGAGLTLGQVKLSKSPPTDWQRLQPCS